MTTTSTEVDKDKFLFNAQIGKRWRDIAVRGGMFESTGGVGTDYYAFNDRLKMTFEAFDFEHRAGAARTLRATASTD